jgi:hypothetical protein
MRLHDFFISLYAFIRFTQNRDLLVWLVALSEIVEIQSRKKEVAM